MAANKSSFWTFGAQVINTLWKQPSRFGNSYFYSADFDPWQELDYLKAFLTIPELNAVIGAKARMFGNGVIKEVDNNGEEVKNSKLVEILNNPNWIQGGKEFRRQTKTFREIFGNEYMYELAPVGVNFEDAKRKALWTIPPNWMKVYFNEEQPFFSFVEIPDSVKYKAVWRGQESTIPTKDLIHLNDDRADMPNTQFSTSGNQSILKGESKIKALTAAINNLKMAYETRGVMLRNRGALGILSNATSDKIGAIPLDPVEKERVQDEYSKYGGLQGQRNLIISSADLRWQQMSIDPDKLGLFQETAEDFNKILDSYGMPSELFVRDKGATYENQNEARKGAYVDTIIPEAQEWIGGFNRKHRQGAKTKLVMDFMHLPLFQEDMKSRGESMNAIVNALSKAFQDGAVDMAQYKEELTKFGLGNTNKK